MTVTESEFMLFRRKILSWYDKYGRDFVWRKHKATAYEILISEILLRRTMAERVQKVFIELVKKYPTCKDLSTANPKDIAKLISSLGLLKRSNVLIEAAKYLSENSDYNFESVKKINGIGYYISGAFMIFYKGQNFPIVDSNIRRVLSRYFGVNDENKIKVMLEELPKKGVREFYYGLIDFGSLICRPIPRCSECMLGEFCQYTDNIK